MSTKRLDAPESSGDRPSPASPPLSPNSLNHDSTESTRTPSPGMPLGSRPTDWKTLSSVICFSLLLHAIVLGLCALIVLQNPQLVEEIFTMITNREDNSEPIVEQSLLQPEEINDNLQPTGEVNDMTSEPSLLNKGPVELDLDNELPQLPADLGQIPGLPDIALAVETSGRMSVQAKRALVTKFGGSNASEAAVALGMKWLKNHQLGDGSWSFSHSKHPDCKGSCSQDGSFDACPTGATGLALLAFLGGGHTHRKGDYQRNVKRGVDYLFKAGKPTTTGLDLRGKVTSNEGMYVQAICAIALCECAAMTKDPRIDKAAESAIEFIVKAQNSTDGGWRYSPGEAGDLSVSGWQIMALKSGYTAKVRLTPQTFKRAELFLNATQAQGGSQYRYVPEPGGETGAGTPTMTAVGLLCRMYLGWNHQNQKLAEGVKYLDQVKPQPNNMYFNYYATQVMHHWGGEEWTRWNSVMREQLIRTQHPLTAGHLAGSWDIADPHGGGGGRLYMTCLSIMTLEVYYRHLPMYSRENIKVEY